MGATGRFHNQLSRCIQPRKRNRGRFVQIQVYGHCVGGNDAELRIRHRATQSVVQTQKAVVFTLKY